jgi:hypothetical protein
MPWSGGTYSKGNSGTGGWTGDQTNGIGIEAGRHDTQDNDFATGINNCLTKDGQNSATANLPMGGFKHTNVASGSARNEYTSIAQFQDGGAVWGGTSGGAANAQTLTLSPALPAYVAGQTFRFRSGFTNTGNVTININGLGAKQILSAKTGGQVPLGSIVTNLVYDITYDGTDFQLLNPSARWQTFAPSITQSVNVTFTTNYSKYMVEGNLCTFQCSLGVTSAGTASNKIVVSKPISSVGSHPNKTVGIATLIDASPFTTYVCSVRDPASGTLEFENDASAANVVGVTPAFTLASGDVISLSVSYEIA